MKAFTKLYLALDASTNAEDKVQALAAYFHIATPDDAAWAIQLCRGKTFKTSIKIKDLQTWCIEVSNIPQWLFAESQLLVGDLSETIALLSGEAEVGMDVSLHALIENYILPLPHQDAALRKKTTHFLWSQMDSDMRLVLNKIITGNLRIDIPDHFLAMALGQISDVSHPLILWRLQSAQILNGEQFQALLTPSHSEEAATQPYPFCNATELKFDKPTMYNPVEWSAEWEWGGIRAQLIFRNSACFIWTENGDILNTSFPEILHDVKALKDYCVLDVKITGWDNAGLPENLLQKTISPKSIRKKTKETIPATAMIFDVIEFQGKDIRHLSLADRRKILENLPISEYLKISPILPAYDWKDIERLHLQTRALNKDGILVRKNSSQYFEGNNDSWISLKRSALRIKAVLIYAQRAQGVSVGQFTQYTFGILHEGQWVGIAKTEHGLSPEEFKEMNTYIHVNKLEKFGPVVTVKPERVYEIEFDAVYASHRHKLGLRVQGAKIVQYIPDAKPEDADTIECIKQMI